MTPSKLTRLVTTLAAWLVAFLTVTAILTLFGDELKSLPVPLRALVISGVLVALMTNLVMPVLSAAIARWTTSAPDRGDSHAQRQGLAYVTLDGVVEAPENWVMLDELMFEEQTADYATSDALLPGRRTYETFAPSWPQRESDVPNAE
jgi:hypothetical protein